MKIVPRRAHSRNCRNCILAALRPQRIAPVLGLVLGLVGDASGDWVTAPSYYTHDPQTGERPQQYTPIGPFYLPPRSDYQRSGYRHTRSSIQVGTSADHLHVVEEWGRPVRPYGEWQFPFRPYSVPYPLWGAPFVGPNWYGSPLPFPHPGSPPHASAYPRQQGGSYPGGRHSSSGYDGDYGERRLPDRQFFQPPIDTP